MLLCGLLFFADAFVNFLEEFLSDDFSEVFFVEVFCGDLFVLFHPVDEESFECFKEDVAEILHRVREGCLLEGRVGDGVCFDAVEEELVAGFEVGPEPLVQFYDP